MTGRRIFRGFWNLIRRYWDVIMRRVFPSVGIKFKAADTPTNRRKRSIRSHRLKTIFNLTTCRICMKLNYPFPFFLAITRSHPWCTYFIVVDLIAASRALPLQISRVNGTKQIRASFETVENTETQKSATTFVQTSINSDWQSEEERSSLFMQL